MKILKSYNFYCSLLENSPFLGNIEILKEIKDWQWNSQKVSESSLFLVFKGDKVDAIQFVPQALREGCCCFVLSPRHEGLANSFLGEYPKALFILEEPLIFLKKGASRVISELPHLLKIGVSGSNGKTTTKELLYGVLSATSKNFYVSSGNYNSQIGMSLSILQLTGKEEVAVFEMGINQIGEMDELVDLLKPNWVILTSFSEAHVGLLGSLENIIKEKSKLTRYAQKVFCSKDLSKMICLEDSFRGEFLTYSLDDIHLDKVTPQGQFFTWKGQPLFLPLLGEGSLWGVCASLRVSQALEIDYEIIKEGFSHVSLPQGRMDLITTNQGVSFLNDAYNANLASLKILLSFLKENNKILENYKRIFIVFSGFKEMGKESVRIHNEAMGEILSLSFWENIFLVEEDLKVFYDELKEKEKVSFSSNLESLFPTAKEVFKRGDLIVLKGSRSSTLERLIKLFE